MMLLYSSISTERILSFYQYLFTPIQILDSFLHSDYYYYYILLQTVSFSHSFNDSNSNNILLSLSLSLVSNSTLYVLAS